MHLEKVSTFNPHYLDSHHHHAVWSLLLGSFSNLTFQSEPPALVPLPLTMVTYTSQCHESLSAGEAASFPSSLLTSQHLLFHCHFFQHYSVFLFFSKHIDGFLKVFKFSFPVFKIFMSYLPLDFIHCLYGTGPLL